MRKAILLLFPTDKGVQVRMIDATTGESWETVAFEDPLRTVSVDVESAEMLIGSCLEMFNATVTSVLGFTNGECVLRVDKPEEAHK